MTFPGDHELGVLEVVVQVELVGDQVEAGQQPSTECGQRAGDATRSARSLDGVDVDAIVVAVALGELFEPAGQHLDLGRGGSLLRSEHPSRIGEPGRHVAGDEQFDTLEAGRRADRLQRAEAAVGRGRSTEARR